VRQARSARQPPKLRAGISGRHAFGPRNRGRHGRRPLLAPPRAGTNNPGPLPWLPGIPPTLLHNHPVWGDYLAKRSQLIADLAGQVQDQAWQGDAEAAWAPPGSHPSTALIGEIAVWWAANGINPQGPRPTGGGQFETLPALSKQRLDRDIAHSTDSSRSTRADERQTRGTARSSYNNRQRPYRNPNGVPAGRSRHADSTPQASDRDARNTRMHSTRPRQTGTPPNLALFICREWYRLSMAPRPAG
jgi:hypothetical protein